MTCRSKWRAKLPPPSEWMTVAEWAESVGVGESTARKWIEMGKVPARRHYRASARRKRHAVLMIAAGTKSAWGDNRQGSRPPTTAKRFVRRGPLLYGRDSPEAAEDRAGFIVRLQRIAWHLAEEPGDVRGTKWMLRALDDHHTTVGLARRLGITADTLMAYKRTGRTPSDVDERAMVLVDELLEHLRMPVDGPREMLEQYVEARPGDPIEGGGW